jgi:hypothetical protein
MPSMKCLTLCKNLFKLNNSEIQISKGLIPLKLGSYDCNAPLHEALQAHQIALYNRMEAGLIFWIKLTLWFTMG